MSAPWKSTHRTPRTARTPRAPQQLALPRDAPIPDGNFVALDVDGRKHRIRKSDLMSVPYFGALRR